MIVDIHTETERGDVLTLKEPLIVHWRGRLLEVPAGFESDGASVPRLFWATVSPRVDPATIRGAVAHDYLYRKHPDGWTRADADELFYDLIRADGLSWWRANKAWLGVRLFGGAAWKEGGK